MCGILLTELALRGNGAYSNLLRRVPEQTPTTVIWCTHDRVMFRWCHPSAPKRRRRRGARGQHTVRASAWGGLGAAWPAQCMRGGSDSGRLRQMRAGPGSVIHGCRGSERGAVAGFVVGLGVMSPLFVMCTGEVTERPVANAPRRVDQDGRTGR